MNTNASLTAGVNGCPESKTGQPITPGNSRAVKQKTHAPYSAEIELGVLRCILMDADYSCGILEADGITPAHFFDLRHQALFRLMMKMRKAGEPIDSQTFFLRAQQKGLAGTPEQINLVSTLEDQTP